MDILTALNPGTAYSTRKLQFILGDYSATTLDRAVTALARHAGHVSAAPLNALNPFKALSAYRFKVMYVHATNVCAWCGKLEREVKKLLGRGGVALCDECVSLCCDILDAELGGSWR